MYVCMCVCVCKCCVCVKVLKEELKIIDFSIQINETATILKTHTDNSFMVIEIYIEVSP